jgi:restriction system protein
VARRKNSGLVEEVAEAIALLVASATWLVRLVWRHPRGALIALGGYLVFSSFALGNNSPTAGVIALALYAGGIWLWHHRQRVREQGRLASVRRHQAQRAATLEDLLVLTPAGFEQAVAGLFGMMGYTDVRCVGGAGDLAADIRCRNEHGGLVVIQCKRYSPYVPVRSPEIQKFIGMAYIEHRADEAIFVTTSSFTDAASVLARKHGVEVIDGRALAALLLARSPAPARPDEGPEAKTVKQTTPNPTADELLAGWGKFKSRPREMRDRFAAEREQAGTPGGQEETNPPPSPASNSAPP